MSIILVFVLSVSFLMACNLPTSRYNVKKKILLQPLKINTRLNYQIYLSLFCKVTFYSLKDGYAPDEFAVRRDSRQNALFHYGTSRKAALAIGISQPTIVRKASKYKIKA